MNRMSTSHVRSVGYLLVVTSLVLLGGCAQNITYRTNYTPCTFSREGDCVDSALQQHKQDKAEYSLGFVEFDDQGQLRSRAQMQAVLDNYYGIAAHHDVLLIVFAHGWHHSAQPGDTNIQQFRQLLSNVANMENTKQAVPRKVLGLYIGWRGESIDIPYVNDLTFWDRKATAHNVGLQGVTEVMLKLEEIVNVKAGIETTQPKPLNSRLVVIGHSFGGAVVYTSLQQVLADRFVNSRKNKTFSDDANGFGDLVVLVNPAFEALRFATLYDISQQDCRRYFSTQLPKMVILTSEKDYATKYVFPLGRVFSTFFETHTTLTRQQCTEQGPQDLLVDEGAAARNTVGHFTPYITHRLVPAKTPQLRGPEFDYRRLQDIWANQHAAGTLAFNGTELIHLNKTRPLNPYLNIMVDGALIPNHNDIWDDRIISFIGDMIGISTLPVAAAK
jgi:hypothetical protein